MSVRESLVRQWRAVANIGVWQYAWNVSARAIAVIASPKSIPLRAKEAVGWAWCRVGTSDRLVFQQVFEDREYSAVTADATIDYVIDCGANVGFTTMALLSQHPNARAICVEPDEDNFRQLRRNLEPYAHRVELLCAGVWARTTRLRLSNTPFRDGRAWARCVEESDPDDPEHLTFPAIGIAELMARTSGNVFLKVDIEGAEAVAFPGQPAPWLDRVQLAAVEIHDDSRYGDARSAVIGTFRTEVFRVEHNGELTVFRRAPRA